MISTTGSVVKPLGRKTILRKLNLNTQYPGVKFRLNSRNMVIMELDHWAHPDKQTQEWEDLARAEMPSEVEFRREHKRDWTSASGKTYFPEYARKKEHYARRVGGLLDAPVARGWDFGYWGLACAWMQYSSKFDRVAILRELFAVEWNTDDFGMAVKYFSGHASLESLRDFPKAFDHVHEYAVMSEKRPDIYPPAPWFPSPLEEPIVFWDFSGPEATAVRPLENERGERTDQEILMGLGIHLSIHGSRIKSRERVWRRLMRDREDGKPGLWVDPSCRILHMALGGRLVRKEATEANPTPEEHKKDGLTDHLYEAASYAIIEICPALEKRFQDKIHQDHRPAFHDTRRNRRGARQRLLPRRTLRRRR